MRIFVTACRMAAGLMWGMALTGAGGPLAAQTAKAGAGRALTIYNQNFAVVRETVRLDLKAGVNAVTFSDITAHLEPDSVVLRDPTGKRGLQMLEQNYRADALSQGLLLSLYEGKTIDFLVNASPNGFAQATGGSRTQTVRGKIIRSGYVPHTLAYSRYGQSYYQSQSQYGNGATGQPVVEVDGKIQFGLPGQPLFPSLADDTILKPTLDWTLQADKGGPLDAELAYVTGGMTWEADYNIVMPEIGQKLDITGLVTLDNQSGRTFEKAKIKLMAGDVNKIQPNYSGGGFGGGGFSGGGGSPPPVTEKAFDEYHLYTLERPTTLRDRETKQVEFVRAHDVLSEPIYVYDGFKTDTSRSYNYDYIRQDQFYGTLSNPKIWTMRSFANTQSSGLGIPLPKGRMRFYRRDADGQLEFTGENTIDHTAPGETIRVYTGNIFDMTGERKQTSFKIDSNAHTVDESFEIRLRSQKKEPVIVRVVEHLYRGPVNWTVTSKSHPFVKNAYDTIEFRVVVVPNVEKLVTYTVHYTW